MKVTISYEEVVEAAIQAVEKELECVVIRESVSDVDGDLTLDIEPRPSR